MRKLANITIGADPEKFVVDGSGTVTNAIGRLMGSKDYPRPVEKGAIQEDNVLAEFNIDPCETEDQFVSHLAIVQREMDKVLGYSKLHSIVLSSHEYDLSYLQELGYAAMEFGCSGEWSAWDGSKMPKPEGALTGLRTAGGHIHIGYNSPDEGTNLHLGQMLDYTLGIPSVLLDDDSRRRILYGKAGSMRHKPYGMEYRVLSNFWLRDEATQRWVFRVAKKSAENLNQLHQMMAQVNPADIIQIINNSDKKGAERVVKQLSLEVA